MNYRKKPVIIQAVQWTRNNISEIAAFTTDIDIIYKPDVEEVVIPTLEGNMTASVGDYIIRGIKGEYYPCKPDIFKATYELVEN